MNTTFNIDGTPDQTTCTIDSTVVECSTLKTYNQLLQDTKVLQKNGINQEEITETMTKGAFLTTSSSQIGGNIDCEKTVMTDELIKNLKPIYD